MSLELRLPSLKDTHIVVVGDVMLDRYWHGEAARVSQEAPVPVVDVQGEEHRPGGAANVALNVVSLGARCTLIGAVGPDSAAQDLRRTLEAAGVTCHFLEVSTYSTIVKLRLVAQRQQLMRADFEQPMPALGDAVEQALRGVLTGAAALVLEDYDKGVLDQPESLIKLAREHGVPVVVDPKAKPLQRYRGATLVKPNDREFTHAVGAWSDDAELIRKGEQACAEHEFAALVVTRGADGMTVIDATAQHAHLPAHAVDVFDVTGAGDTTAATLAVALAVGWSAERAALAANLAASLVVAKLGTATVTGPELAYAASTTGADDKGIVNRTQLELLVTRAKAVGERVVFTNGCFDILHAGHVEYLEQARALGDRLVVAVNDDASVRRLKGSGRPVNPLDLRLRVLAGLSAVDWVLGFDEDTPEPLLQLVQPDVLVKGGDYQGAEQVVGHEIVFAYGGDVQVLGLVDDCSTTAIVEQLAASGRESGD